MSNIHNKLNTCISSKCKSQWTVIGQIYFRYLSAVISLNNYLFNMLTYSYCIYAKNIISICIILVSFGIVFFWATLYIKDNSIWWNVWKNDIELACKLALWYYPFGGDYASDDTLPMIIALSCICITCVRSIECISSCWSIFVIKLWYGIYDMQFNSMIYFGIKFHRTSQLTIYGCSNISTTMGGIMKTLKLKLLQRIPWKFHERCHNVAAKHCKKTSPQHYGNIEMLRYSQCCCNLSATWENPRRSYQKNIDGVKSDPHTISLADFMFHFR